MLTRRHIIFGTSQGLCSRNNRSLTFNRRDKVRARIHDPVLQEKLAPLVKPHPYGCKRVSLENGYYELFNLDHTELVDVNETPIVSFTPTGIKTTVKEYDFDIVISATGFDAVTGGILAMNLTGNDGVGLEEMWSGCVKTYMGISIPEFPNM
jgi:cation diffusion facilitator CzcD-associated flavoprotein CzcO